MAADDDPLAAGALGPIMSSMLDAVIAVDAAGQIVAWNEVASKTFGWTRAEAVGRLLGELIVPPEHRRQHQGGMRRYLQTREARMLNRRVETSAMDKSGRTFPIEMSVIATPGEGPAAFVGFLRDIRDRRGEQDRLVLSEESLRLITDAAEIGTWDLDLLTDELTWSDRTKAMFGISPGVPCSMDDFYAGLHPEDREATSRAFASALDPDLRATYDVQYRTVGKEDGLIRWVAAKGRGLFDEQGRCVRALGTAIDVTARKLADARHAFMLELSDLLRGADTDAALQAACGLMGAYFGVCRVGYGHLDPEEDVFDYTICWTDGVAPPLLGRFPAHAFGPKIVAKLSAGETVVVDDLFAAAISDEAETRETASSVDTRAILVVPFVRAGRLRTIVYLNDRPARRWREDEIGFMEEVAERTRQVIERGEAEAALRALNATLEARVEERTRALMATEEALRQSQKMEAVGQLTGGIAHDFNNLLQGITGSLDLMRRRLNEGRSGELDRYVDGAMASAARAAALTHRLLAFSRRQPLDPRRVQIDALIASMAEILRRSLGENIRFTFAPCEGLWPTRCDANQLENALLNLAINARDAMPEGGDLLIETSNVELGGDLAAQLDLAPGCYACIRVADTGQGMTPETMERAFEPFFTTKPTGQGTGLGLSMIYGFARQSHGGVKLSSELGRGVEVRLYLPRDDTDESEPAPQASGLLAPTPEKAECVLVVEDQPVVRGLIVEVLHELGYTALEAVDGPSGLEILRSSRQIDLLISDIGLPGLNGRQMAEAARAVRPQLKVLFMTGYDGTEGSPANLAGTETALITKPFSMDVLAQRIRAVIESE